MVFIDCDMYDTTELILKLLHKKLSKNGLIVFDEALLGSGGEGVSDSVIVAVPVIVVFILLGVWSIRLI